MTDCGAAMRRRQRRLRAWARHERLSIAMALATVEHHSFGPTANAAPRGQTTGTSAREGVEGEANDVPRHQKPPPPGTRPERLVDARCRREGWSVRLARALKPPPPLSRRRGAGGGT